MKLTLICFLVVLLQFAACAPRKSQRAQKSLEPAAETIASQSTSVTRHKKQDDASDEESDEDNELVKNRNDISNVNVSATTKLPAPGIGSSSGSFLSFIGRIARSLFSNGISTILNSSNVFRASSTAFGASSG